MSFRYRTAIVAVAIGVSTLAVMAQPVAAPAASAAPASAPPNGQYRSAFEGYRGFSEQPVGSWRQANDLVRQIGGWQAYAREGQGPPRDAAASAAAAAPAGHAGHEPSPGTGTAPALPLAASSPGPSPAPVKAPRPAPGAIRPAPAGNHSGHH